MCSVYRHVNRHACRHVTRRRYDARLWHVLMFRDRPPDARPPKRHFCSCQAFRSSLTTDKMFRDLDEMPRHMYYCQIFTPLLPKKQNRSGPRRDARALVGRPARAPRHHVRRQLPGAVVLGNFSFRQRWLRRPLGQYRANAPTLFFLAIDSRRRNGSPKL